RDRGKGGGRAGGNRGDILDLLLLVRGVSLPGGRYPEGALLLREDARLREPPGPLRRRARAAGRAPGELHPGVQPPRPDQRRVRPRSTALGRRVEGVDHPRGSVRRRNSSRVMGQSAKTPRIALVMVREFCFSTPRIIMQRWLASTTTPTPRGWSASQR